MKPDSRRIAIRRDFDTARPSLRDQLLQRTHTLACSDLLNISHNLRLQRLNGAVCQRVDIQTKPHALGHRIRRAGLQIQNPRQRQRRMRRRQPMRLQHHLRRREQRIRAAPEIRRPRVARAARNLDRVPAVRLDTFHDADFAVRDLEQWTLLDVQLEVRGHVDGVVIAGRAALVADAREAGGEGRDAWVHFAEVMCGEERDAAGPDAGGEHGDGEAGAFFASGWVSLRCCCSWEGGLICPVDNAYWVFCLYPVVGEHLQHLGSCCDAEYAIVFSASGLGVEVRAGKGGWGVIAEAWSHGEDIAHGIDGSMAAQCLGCLDEPVSSLLVGVGEGQAAHACFGGCVSPSLSCTPLARIMYILHKSVLVDFRAG